MQDLSIGETGPGVKGKEAMGGVEHYPVEVFDEPAALPGQHLRGMASGAPERLLAGKEERSGVVVSDEQDKTPKPFPSPSPTSAVAASLG
jgi:hypothetical protein